MDIPVLNLPSFPCEVVTNSVPIRAARGRAFPHRGVFLLHWGPELIRELNGNPLQADIAAMSLGHQEGPFARREMFLFNAVVQAPIRRTPALDDRKPQAS
jgi:hypothetical protein